MTSLESILKSRDITLLMQLHIVKAMVFPVVICVCESWTIRRLMAKELVPLNCGVGEDSLFFSYIFISWRLITLQYCSGFCHTLT